MHGEESPWHHKCKDGRSPGREADLEVGLGSWIQRRSGQFETDCAKKVAEAWRCPDPLIEFELVVRDSERLSLLFDNFFY